MNAICAWNTEGKRCLLEVTGGRRAPATAVPGAEEREEEEERKVPARLLMLRRLVPAAVLCVRFLTAVYS